MDVMNILYGDIENEISAYTAIGMFRKIVPGTLAPYQMAQFFDHFQHHKCFYMVWPFFWPSETTTQQPTD